MSSQCNLSYLKMKRAVSICTGSQGHTHSAAQSSHTLGQVALQFLSCHRERQAKWTS